MKFRLRSLFGVNASGKSVLGNTRRQLIIGGIVCLLIWPGLGLVLLASGALQPEQRIYAFLSPFLVVTGLGIYLLGQSVFISPKATHTDKQKNKEKR